MFPLIAKTQLCVTFRDLHSYLLGDQEENENNANQQANNNQQARNNAIPVVGEGLHAAHQAILQQGGPVGFQPYHRPMKFPLRVLMFFHPHCQYCEDCHGLFDFNLNRLMFFHPVDRVADFVHVRDTAFGQLGVSYITRLDNNTFSKTNCAICLRFNPY